MLDKKKMAGTNVLFLHKQLCLNILYTPLNSLKAMHKVWLGLKESGLFGHLYDSNVGYLGTYLLEFKMCNM